MHRKSKSFKKFKEFKAVVEMRHSEIIKFLRSDRGGEYISDEFWGYLAEVGIESQITASGRP